MTRRSLFSSLFGASLLSVALLAQAPAGAPPQAPAGAPPPGGRGPAAPPMLQTQKVKDNLYVITGGGGNSTVFITENNGVVVIDAKNPGVGKLLLEQISKITTQPVTMLINSHTHADHTGGNVDFPVTTRFVAHVNTRTNMQKMDQFQGDNTKFLPTQVFQDKISLFSGTDRIDLYYFGPGGTNGDSWIVIPSLRLLIGADNFNKGLTLLDGMNGGSAKAFQQTLARVASEIKNVDTVVTGHGGVLTWNDFLEFTQLTNDFYTWVRAQKAAGKPVEQTAMEWQTPAKYVGYAPTNPMFLQRIVQVVYSEAP